MLSVAVQSDAGGLLEQGTSLIGAIGEQEIDHLGLHDDPGVAAEAGAPEEVVDIAKPDGTLVDEVVAAARPGHPAGDDDFVVGDRQVAGGVVEEERDFGDVDRPPVDRALEDHVFHLAAAEEPGRRFAEDPADGVRDIGLPAPIGAHDGGDAMIEFESDGVSERLEAGEFQLEQFHVGSERWLSWRRRFCRAGAKIAGVVRVGLLVNRWVGQDEIRSSEFPAGLFGGLAGPIGADDDPIPLVGGGRIDHFGWKSGRR